MQCDTSFKLFDGNSMMSNGQLTVRSSSFPYIWFSSSTILKLTFERAEKMGKKMVNICVLVPFPVYFMIKFAISNKYHTSSFIRNRSNLEKHLHLRKDFLSDFEKHF